MKILKPILYCLLWFLLAFLVMYFINDKKVKVGEVSVDSMELEEEDKNVSLRVSPRDVSAWDTVTYTVTFSAEFDDENLESSRTFYYDFTWDWIWDLVTKKDSATYIFDEPYEDWVVSIVGVEYWWKLLQIKWDTIYVVEKLVPNLLYSSIWNKVIFRDLSKWPFVEKEICFENSECDVWNSKYKKIQRIGNEVEWMMGWISKITTENDVFLFDYDNYWTHNVSIYLKDKYWNKVQKQYGVMTYSDKNDWIIDFGVNIITVPEAKIINWNPQIFLDKEMNNTLIMYINNETLETCYVDTDISVDSNWDWKLDNDMDNQCNNVVKIEYNSDYVSAIWKIYFMSGGKLLSKNFYVTIEWYVLELDDDQLEIYNDITTLVNEIEDLSVENTDLKKSLDRLRKNLNNRPEVTTLVVQINEQIDNWWIMIDIKEKELLDSILFRLSNEDTIVLVRTNEYERNRDEIYALLPTQSSNIKSVVEAMFQTFDDNSYSYTREERAIELENIWDTIIKDGKKNSWIFNESDFTPYFCNIFDYYDIVTYTDKCK